MASLSEIAATTYEYREKKPADLVADNVPFLYLIREEGNYKVIPGLLHHIEPDLRHVDSNLWQIPDDAFPP